MSKSEEYYRSPCRVVFKVKNGYRARLGGYQLIDKMRSEGRLIAAYSMSTGKQIS